MKTVAIVGSREKYWKEIDAIREGSFYVQEYIWKRRHFCKFISGASPGGGVDYWAERFCKARIIPFQAYPPTRFTTAEFHKRNRVIAEEADVIVAFCAGRITGGTKYTIEYAKGLGKHVIVYTYKDGEWQREEFNADVSTDQV